MFRGKDVEQVNELKREGLSIRAISRLTGYSRKTISKYLGRGFTVEASIGHIRDLPQGAKQIPAQYTKYR